MANTSSDHLINLAWVGAILYGIGFFLLNAYQIRLQAINEYGPVIHEFDPYFNWRATQVSAHGIMHYLSVVFPSASSVHNDFLCRLSGRFLLLYCNICPVPL